MIIGSVYELDVRFVRDICRPEPQASEPRKVVYMLDVFVKKMYKTEVQFTEKEETVGLAKYCIYDKRKPCELGEGVVPLTDLITDPQLQD